MKIPHYLDDDRCPIKDFTIAKECQNMLLGTTEKRERWKAIQKKHSNRLATNKTLQHEQPIK